MNLSNKDYAQFVQDRAKKSPVVKDCTLAFLIGGARPFWTATPPLG